MPGGKIETKTFNTKCDLGYYMTSMNIGKFTVFKNVCQNGASGTIRSLGNHATKLCVHGGPSAGSSCSTHNRGCGNSGHIVKTCIQTFILHLYL